MLTILVKVVIYLVIAGLIYFVIRWGLDEIKLPEPFNKVARVILILLVVIAVCYALLTLAGVPLPAM